MAVAEAKKADKDDAQAPAAGAKALGGALDVVPRKLGEARTFLGEVRAELKKVTWPGREEVQATTAVVIATTVFFGCYLFTLDLGLSWLMRHVLKH